jgi:hypothetical protein
MKLVPTQSPGRGTRKARDFGAEIVQLRAQGYTLEAIRIALANAGVHVTISTVWREANRASLPHLVKSIGQPPATSMPPPSQSLDPTAPVASAARDAAQNVPGRRNGKEVAETFMRGQITNPLIRSKEQR